MNDIKFTKPAMCNACGKYCGESECQYHEIIFCTKCAEKLREITELVYLDGNFKDKLVGFMKRFEEIHKNGD